MSTRAVAQCAFGGTFYNVAATPAACPGAATVSCIWGGEYVLVNVVAGNTYTFSTCGLATWDTQITVFNNTGGAVQAYNDDACGLQSSVTWTATFTGTVRVLVNQWDCATNFSCADLSVSCTGGTPPTGTCGSVVYDIGGPSGPYTSGENYSVTYCPDSPGDVVTFSFTSFATELGYDFVTLYNGNSTGSPVFGTFSGATNPGAFTSTHPSGCITLQFTSDGSITYSGWAATISCAPPPPPPAGDCVYVLTLQDSWGDGWGSSSVGLSINGGPFQNYTVNTFSNQIIFGVDIGDLVVLSYNNSGAFQGENSYFLTLQSGGTLFTSGTPPAAGIQFTGVVDCIPPPAPPEDCEGAITICSNQAFNANTNNTGSVADLNAGNQGCLSASERQGTWYTFSPSTSGTVAFTISPTDPTDDYDFAMWGPYPPGSTTANVCPPAGAPVRCSFAAPSGDTGLNFTATDVSESPSGDKWVRYLDVVQDQVYLMYISNFSQSGLAFGLNWNPAMTAELDCTVLTAELTGLVATPAADRVELAWTTLSEENSHRFVVERSGDGERFVELGFLPAQGNSQVRTDYRFQDRAPLKGVNYYRLRSVDLDGVAELSNVAVVRFGISAPLLAPNPAQNELTLLWDNSGDTPVEVRITDGSGRLVAVRNLTGAGTRHGLQVHDLEGGAYLLSLHGQDGSPLGQVRFIKE